MKPRPTPIMVGVLLVAALALAQCAGGPTTAPTSTAPAATPAAPVPTDTAAPPALTPTATATPPAQVSEPFIKIVDPMTGDTLAGAVVVRGRAGGLFENTLVLELRDASGQALVVLPVTLAVPEMGMAGEFQATLRWTPPAEPTTGTLWGIYYSPKDGSVAASDHLDVTLVPVP